MSTIAKLVWLMVLYNNMKRNLGQIKIVKIPYQAMVNIQMKNAIITGITPLLATLSLTNIKMIT